MSQDSDQQDCYDPNSLGSSGLPNHSIDESSSSHGVENHSVTGPPDMRGKAFPPAGHAYPKGAYGREMQQGTKLLPGTVQGAAAGSTLPIRDLSSQNVVSPSVTEAVTALFNDEEKERLRSNLIEEQIKQAKYLREHPEINNLLQIAIGNLVKAQPEDPVDYLTKFFADQDLEALEASHRKHEEHLQAVVREKHAQLADPTSFSLP